MSTDILVSLIALGTSLISAVIGFGGGMLLIATLPLFLNPHLIIPIHGITQLASNTSRVAFSFSYVQWQLLPKFLIGSIFGMLLFGTIIFNVPLDFLPVAIGVYLILNLWVEAFSTWMRQFESYYFVGFLQTGLGLIVGSPGPLYLAVLTKDIQSKDQIVATSALFSTISHIAKIPVYASLVPELQHSLLLIISMSLASIIGSFIGTRLRFKADNKILIRLIKYLLTLLAIKMIVTIFFL